VIVELARARGRERAEQAVAREAGRAPAQAVRLPESGVPREHEVAQLLAVAVLERDPRRGQELRLEREALLAVGAANLARPGVRREPEVPKALLSRQHS
jgi:hypothetical protein